MLGWRSGIALWPLTLAVTALGLGLGALRIRGPGALPPPVDEARQPRQGESSNRGATLCLEPSWLFLPAPGAELLVRRADGGGFASPTGEPVWVGVTFDGLLHLRTRPVTSDPPWVLVAHLPPLGELWDPPPRVGDRLLVAVYAGDHPVSLPAELSLLAGSSPPPPSQSPPGRVAPCADRP